MNPSFLIRGANPEDISAIHSLLQGLADYSQMSNEFVVTQENLKASLFGEDRVGECLLAVVDNVPVGIAVFFNNYSSFLAKTGIYLEYLFVLPEHRGNGIGKALFGAVAKIAVERDCRRFEWAVLEWNKASIKFYDSLGASKLQDIRICRLIDEPLKRVAQLYG